MHKSTTLLCILLGLSGPLSAQPTQSQRTENIGTSFFPTGWMGDGQYGRDQIDFSSTDRQFARGKLAPAKFSYTFGRTRWGGVCWQNRENNFGDKPGEDFSKRGFTTLTFWARGGSGGEAVNFKAGGVNDAKRQFRDSFETETKKLELTTSWTRYSIDLTGKNLSSVITGFCWVASADFNAQKRIVFYVDEIQFE